MSAQESLGGNAKTSLVIAVANALEHGDETLQSLQFGTRAMRVRTQAVVNERDNFRVINAELARPAGFRLYHLAPAFLGSVCSRCSQAVGHHAFFQLQQGAMRHSAASSARKLHR